MRRGERGKSRADLCLTEATKKLPWTFFPYFPLREKKHETISGPIKEKSKLHVPPHPFPIDYSCLFMIKLRLFVI